MPAPGSRQHVLRTAERQFDREDGAAPDLRPHVDGVVQQPGQAPDDGRSRELDDLKRRLRELEEKLRMLSDGSGN